MSKEIDEFVRDLCSVEFRVKSITRIRVRKFVAEYKAKIIQIGDEMREFHKHNAISSRLSLEGRCSICIRNQAFFAYQKNIEKA